MIKDPPSSTRLTSHNPLRFSHALIAALLPQQNTQTCCSSSIFWVLRCVECDRFQADPWHYNLCPGANLIGGRPPAPHAVEQMRSRLPKSNPGESRQDRVVAYLWNSCCHMFSPVLGCVMIDIYYMLSQVMSGLLWHHLPLWHPGQIATPHIQVHG